MTQRNLRWKVLETVASHLNYLSLIASLLIY